MSDLTKAEFTIQVLSGRNANILKSVQSEFWNYVHNKKNKKHISAAKGGNNRPKAKGFGRKGIGRTYNANQMRPSAHGYPKV